MYQYHLFPMFFIFVLISFAALIDDITLKMFGKNKRSKALFLGFATLITTIVVEDFAWFVNRWLFPLESDPNGGQLMHYSDWTSKHIGAIDAGDFVIPVWYLLAIGLATVGYYAAFRRHDEWEYE